MKKKIRREIIKEFEERYKHNNSKLLKGIRELLITPAGVLLIAGQAEWLDEKLSWNEK